MSEEEIVSFGSFNFEAIELTLSVILLTASLCSVSDVLKEILSIKSLCNTSSISVETVSNKLEIVVSVHSI